MARWQPRGLPRIGPMVEERRHVSEQQDGIGAPDGLERLWTPYRIAYLRGENKPADDSAGECPFCRIPKLGDEPLGCWCGAASCRTPCSTSTPTRRAT